MPQGGKPPLRAVIFDVDGVLVQSMERHHEAYRRAFADLRIEVKREEVFANEGRRSKEVIEAIAKSRGIRLLEEQLEEMNRLKQQTFLAFGPLPLYPGVPELIAKIREAGIKVAAVSGTTRQNIDNHFGGALVKRFDVIVSADDVKLTKPDPEPYLAALTKLAVKPEEAVVVENATLGIKSAKAARLRVIGVTSTLPPEKLADADVTVSKVADVWGILEQWR